MNSNHRASILPAAIALAAVLGAGEVALSAPGDQVSGSRAFPEQVTFNAHIRPIMSKTCFACHGPDHEGNHSGYMVDTFEHATAALESDEELRGIVPGKPEQSEVYLRVAGTSEAGERMPPEDFRHDLSEYEIELFRRWIEQGAEYEQHWSYAPVRDQAPPTPEGSTDWSANPIDAFILDRLSREGLEPSPAADRATLLRRLSLDLIGLPPSLDEQQAFVNADAVTAYGEAVERLLASPHYGERMASSWLDIVRFSDTVGFHGDQNQRIFPYRDYVINAFNDNKPFDEFTEEQLAGDLMPNPTAEQLVATGFLRLNMMTREGGAQPGEYLAKYKADRVRALGAAWLGSTLGCCECHNHKYDPFSTKDFYAFGAFFDDLQQWGVYQNYGYTPNPDLTGFSNHHPFPPEIRVESRSLSELIQREQRVRDELLAKQLPAALAESEEFGEWVEELLGFVGSWPSGWAPMTVQKSKTLLGTETTTLDDGSFLLTGKPRQGERLTVELTAPHAMTVNSVRLEVLPDELNDGHVGRAAGGRFMVASVTATVVEQSQQDLTPEMIPNRPRYVRIELPGANRILSLAEVEVMVLDANGKLRNIAPEGVAKQSSDYRKEFPASLAIDGDKSGDLKKTKSTTHTTSEASPWWEVDLGSEMKIEEVRVWNRTDSGLESRLDDARLVLYDANRQRSYTQEFKPARPSATIVVPAEVDRGRVETVEIAWAQADRRTPKEYRSGFEAATMRRGWRSGPTRWQLPRDESKVKHTAVYHFASPQQIGAGKSLRLTLDSEDVGRLRFSATTIGHAIAGWDAASPELRESAATPAHQRTALQRAALLSAYHRSTLPFAEQLPTSRKSRDSILEMRSGLALSLVAQPIAPEKFPVSRVLPRGNWQDESGELAPPAFPEFLGVDFPAGGKDRLDRADLANWLTSPTNPLTPRHFVNRLWRHFFGRGLSGKMDDLGSQGEWPSHPELLDWMAKEFVRSGWDVKHMVRLIVTSNAYQQAAAVRNDLADIDPYNRLHAQQSARRLEAEIIRDNALFVSGLLVKDVIGGPSVFPYQPAGHYRNLQFPGRRYVASDDWQQYRRGVYMHWQRTFLHPMLVNFDAPSRDECTAERSLSNSPQQALTLLNDPTFVEAANALAAGLLEEYSEEDFKGVLQAAFLKALARKPADQELTGLQRLYQTQLSYYRDNPAEIGKLLGTGLKEIAPEKRTPELAAYAQVCRVVLNLHETITRY